MPGGTADAAPPDEVTTRTGGVTIPVLIPLPLGAPYDYRLPEGIALTAGDVVEVPLANRRVWGVVWDDTGGRLPVEPGKLKPVIRRLDVPAMRTPMRRLIDWIAAYTLAPQGAVLRMALPGAGLEPPRRVQALRRVTGRPTAGLRMTPARERVLALLDGETSMTAAEVRARASVGQGVVRGLVEAGVMETVWLSSPAPPRLDHRRNGPELSPAQGEAAAALARAVDDHTFGVTLLDGVTGSGKTEVYFEAVAAALARGRQVLVLLPEIALTAQWLGRFAERFGAEPAAWHSEVGQGERRRVWHAVADGRAQVVVGARSALFLPFRELGLVVVDEEHEAAFKQEDGVRYHARDMAIVRAKLEEVPCVLASATPSLETLVNVERGRYAVRHLPERHAGAAMPRVEVVDMRRTPPERGTWLAPPLVQAIGETLAGGEQALLFLNRRGYAPLTLCRACGHRLACPNCTTWLVEHRYIGRLECHHCGFHLPIPDACPVCEAEGSLVSCGPGVERVAEEVLQRWPEARSVVMASDTLDGPGAVAELVRRIEQREVDIVVGTQLVAKGHHFPMLTTVGVVDADLGLNGGDLRAGERTFQLLSQVAGRAGRAERPGRVFLQTHAPEASVMRALASGDRAAFEESEKAARRAAGMPPFGRLAALIVVSSDRAAAEEAAHALARAAPSEAGATVLGPAPAPLAQLRGQFRFRLLLKAERGVEVQRLLRRWLGRIQLPSKVRVQVDVDPYSFL